MRFLDDSNRSTPSDLLPETTLRSAVVAPPIVLPVEFWMRTPASLPRRTFPATSEPDPPTIRMPSSANPPIASPRIVVPPAVATRPWIDPASWGLEAMSEPSSETIGEPAYPGCVVASRMVGSVMAGKGEAGRIASPSLGSVKSIVSTPGLASAFWIAWRSEPYPESRVLKTVKVKIERVVIDAVTWTSSWPAK